MICLADDQIPRLRPVYLYYCSRQQSASNRLLELLTDTSTAAHLNDCWAQIKSQTHAWNLDSMLIKPVQRITKYPLLFEDLLACTTPVHPDYFHIRTAAELARTIAVEIDEAKRRKDVVANAINTRHPKTPKSTNPSPGNKETKKGLKIFRKDKTASATALAHAVSVANVSGDAPPPEITRTSFGLLRDLVARVEEADQVVRRVGKEIIIWTASAKEILVAEDQLLITWSRVTQLDSSDPPLDRMREFRRILDNIMAGPWAVLVSLSSPRCVGADGQNEEIRDRIMPIFSKLLESTVNPRKVIVKRESKSQDYVRYTNLLKARKSADRSLLVSARDFYALHCQLVEELPIFLERYTRILDLALRAFAEAQARYFEGVKTHLGEFTKRWIARPRRDTLGNGSEATQGDVDMMTGRGIVKAWHDSWQPYAEAMDHFQCIKPGELFSRRLSVQRLLVLTL
jgi:hypothetical protein